LHKKGGIRLKELRAVDLFAGAGGLSEGLIQAHFKVIIANEKQKDAAATYRKNHPHTNMIEGDIVEIGDTKIIPAIKDEIKENGEIDLIAAGPPCQGFSLAGRRNINDKRNSLFKELVKIVHETKPRFFLMENVKGILSMDQGRVIRAIEKAFQEKEGYAVQHYVLDAAWFGVPQHRERVFILGRKDGVKPISPIDINNLPTDFVTVGEAISDLDFLEAGQTSNEYLKAAESNYQKQMREGCGRYDLHNHEAPNHSKQVIMRFAQFKEGQTMKEIPDGWQTKKRNVFRFEKNKPCWTLTTLPDDYIHYSQNRIPTVREFARLQSFPDHYIFNGKKCTGGLQRRVDVPQYSQVGNAVPPLLAKGVGLCIKSQL
jgi:DNA (cytosine-5)-methyltransferase 1